MDLVSQAKAQNKRTEDALSKAFEFLVNEYNYKEESITYGPHHLTAFTKAFNFGTRSIIFLADHDSSLFYDLFFQPVNLQARSQMHPSINYRSHWNFSIHRVIECLDADIFLPQSGTLEKVASAFSDALRNHAVELIKGDFSTFRPIEFIVNQVRLPNECNTLGRFSTIEEAEQLAFTKEAELEATSDARIEIVGTELDAGRA